MKKLLKEMVYLGLGTAVVAKHKTEELLENLIKQHHLTRDEGERVVDDMKAQVQRAKQTTDELTERFVKQFAEKSHLAEEEIRNLIYDILDKPKKAKNKISKETHVLAQKIADKTAMTKDQANKLLEDFTDEILQISHEVKEKSKALSNKVSKASKKGKSFIEDLEARSDMLLHEAKPRIQQAMDKTIDRLHLANTEQVDSLEKRIQKLEKKKVSK